MDPKIGPKTAKYGIKKWTHVWICFSDFWAPFWVHFGSHFGAKEAMMRQDGPKKDLKSFKVPKSSNCKKCDFTNGKPYFLSLGGSQDEHKRLKTALKRHLKCFKTRKIRVRNFTVFLIFGTSFGEVLGPKTNPKIHRKSINKVIKN